MRLVRLLPGAAAVMVSCGLAEDAQPACRPGERDGSVSVETAARDLRAEELVESVRSGSAELFLFAAPHEPTAGDTVYVLCEDGAVSEAGYTNDVLLADRVSPGAFRIAAGTTGTDDGEIEIDPGYVAGRVVDESIAAVRVTWDGGHGGVPGDRTIDLGMGTFLHRLPVEVHPSAQLTFEFLDANGDVVWTDD